MTTLLKALDGMSEAVNAAQNSECIYSQKVSELLQTRSNEELKTYIDNVAKCETQTKTVEKKKKHVSFWSKCKKAFTTVATVSVIVAACTIVGQPEIGAAVVLGTALSTKGLGGGGKSIMDRAVQGVSDGLQKAGMNKTAADLVARILIVVVVMAACGGAGSASDVAGYGYSMAYLGGAVAIASTNLIVTYANDMMDELGVPKNSWVRPFVDCLAQIGQMVLMFTAASGASLETAAPTGLLGLARVCSYFGLIFGLAGSGTVGLLFQAPSQVELGIAEKNMQKLISEGVIIEGLLDVITSTMQSIQGSLKSVMGSFSALTANDAHLCDELQAVSNQLLRA